MRIETLTVSGFRCFGPEPATVALDPCLTTLVGANGAGKTALLQASLVSLELALLSASCESATFTFL